MNRYTGSLVGVFANGKLEPFRVDRFPIFGAEFVSGFRLRLVQLGLVEWLGGRVGGGVSRGPFCIFGPLKTSATSQDHRK